MTNDIFYDGVDVVAFMLKSSEPSCKCNGEPVELCATVRTEKEWVFSIDSLTILYLALACNLHSLSSFHII